MIQMPVKTPAKKTKTAAKPMSKKWYTGKWGEYRMREIKEHPSFLSAKKYAYNEVKRYGDIVYISTSPEVKTYTSTNDYYIVNDDLDSYNPRTYRYEKVEICYHKNKTLKKATLLPTGGIVKKGSTPKQGAYTIHVGSRSKGPYSTLADAKKEAEEWSGDSDWDYLYGVDYVTVKIAKNGKTVGYISDITGKYVPVSRK